MGARSRVKKKDKPVETAAAALLSGLKSKTSSSTSGLGLPSLGTVSEDNTGKSMPNGGAEVGSSGLDAAAYNMLGARRGAPRGAAERGKAKPKQARGHKTTSRLQDGLAAALLADPEADADAHLDTDAGAGADMLFGRQPQPLSPK